MLGRARRSAVTLLALCLFVLQVPAAQTQEHGWSLSRIIGSDVRGSDGGKVGEVEDIVVTPEGRLSSVIVKDTGFLWLGGDFMQVAWQTVGWSQSEEALFLPMTRDAAEQSPMVDDGWREAFVAPEDLTVRQILAMPVQSPDGSIHAEVDDLLFDPLAGHVRGALINPSISPEAPRRVVPWRPQFLADRQQALVIPPDSIQSAAPPDID